MTKESFDEVMSRRWTSTVPDDVMNPKGPESALMRAAFALGPFRCRTDEEAQNCAEDWPGNIALSAELAFERIFVLARDYNRQQHLNAKAPRPKDVIENLRALENLSGALAMLLLSFDDITRHRLRTGGSGIRGFGDVIEVPIMKSARACDLPAPGPTIKEPINSAWVNDLGALSQYAGFCRETFLHTEGLADQTRVDKGGNTNLHKSLFGSPQWSLVNNGWHLYEMFKPGQTTGTEGGPFHRFLMDVFEYATGLDPEIHSKLEYWLKRTTKTNRSYVAITAKQSELEESMEQIWKSRPDNMEEALEKLRNQLFAAERKRQDLWAQMFPFTYTQAKARKRAS